MKAAQAVEPVLARRSAFNVYRKMTLAPAPIASNSSPRTCRSSNNQDFPPVVGDALSRGPRRPWKPEVLAQLGLGFLQLCRGPRQYLDDPGFRLGVVTNGGIDGQNRKIDRLGLRGRLAAVIVSEAVGCAKPDAKIFEIACRAIGVAARDCWFVGDHPENDVLGAERAGLTAVWFSGEAGSHAWPGSAPEPARRISALALLPGLIERHERSARGGA